MHTASVSVVLAILFLGSMAKAPPPSAKTDRRAKRESAFQQVNNFAEELSLKRVTMREFREDSESVMAALWEQVCKAAGPPVPP